MGAMELDEWELQLETLILVGDRHVVLAPRPDLGLLRRLRGRA